MKSKVIKDRMIIECSCGSPDHIFVIDDCEDIMSLNVSFRYNKVRLRDRIIGVIKFLFKKEDLYIADIMISYEQYEEIQELADMMKKKINEIGVSV